MIADLVLYTFHHGLGSEMKPFSFTFFCMKLDRMTFFCMKLLDLQLAYSVGMLCIGFIQNPCTASACSATQKGLIQHVALQAPIQVVCCDYRKPRAR